MDIDIIKTKTLEIITEQDLEQKLKKGKKLKIKYGADPSAPDLHIGHAVCFRKLKQFQELGHDIIFIIGDFTAQIGDPSGRSKTRPKLSKQEVEKNAKTYMQQVYKILDKEKTTIRYNSEWLSKFNILNIMDLTSRYTVARMLERDDFEKRYNKGNPISILEFLYPLLQAYDSVAVKADVEIGGSDQKFNFLLAREIQKEYGQYPQVVITMPLLEGIDGKLKMSKSYHNQIGLLDSPKDMFGKVMSIPDTSILNYFELATDLTPPKSKNPRDTKARLASEIVSIYHGKEAARNAELEFNKIFRDKKLPEKIPEYKITEKTRLGDKIWIVKLLEQTGLSQTRSEARRLIGQGGVSIDGTPIRDANLEIELNKDFILKVGKRKFLKVQVPII